MWQTVQNAGDKKVDSLMFRDLKSRQTQLHIDNTEEAVIASY